MASQHVLISVDNSKIFHLSQGQESPLFEGTVSLVLVNVPLDPPPNYASASTDSKRSAPPLPPRSRSASPRVGENDQYLVMTVSTGSEVLLEVALPASARIMTVPPRSYVIPSTMSSNEDEAGFFKVTLPDAVDAEDQERFESVLWGLTSFSAEGGQAQAHSDAGDPTLRNALVLVDEDTGRVVGRLADDSKVTADASLGAEDQKGHEKEPVVVESGAGGQITVQPASKFTPLDNPSNSKTVDLANFVSRGIIVGAQTLAKGMEQGANKFVQSSKPADSPLVFNARSKTTVDHVSKYTSTALTVSGKTVAAIGSAASVVGDRVGKTLGIQSTPSGKAPKGIRGSLNRGLLAFNAVLDAAEAGGRTLLDSGSASATTMVSHKYGSEAGNVAHSVGSSVKRCALVYVDVRGISRRAVLKAAGKSAIRARMDDGREVILSEDPVTEKELQKVNEKA